MRNALYAFKQEVEKLEYNNSCTSEIDLIHCHNTKVKFTTIDLKTDVLLPEINRSPAQLTGAVEYTNCISEYDTKPSNGEVAPAPELGQIWTTLSLLPDPLSPRVVVPDRVISMGQIELFHHLNYVQTSDLC